MFKLLLENIDVNEAYHFTLDYANYSEVFFKNIKLFQQDAEIYNQLCRNLVRLVVNKGMLPIYDIFSTKILNNEEYDIADFDPDNLWLDLVEQSDDNNLNKTLQHHKSLDLINRSIEHNKAIITKEETSLFTKLLQLNDYLNEKYI